MELDKVHIRPFLPKEWPDLKAKRLQALQDLPHLFLVGYDDAITKPDEYWHDMIGNEKSEIFGLFNAGKVIGITGVFENWRYPPGEVGHLGMSYLDPEYRGHGLSRLLYQARIDWCRAKGFKKVTVGHREGNEASKAANQKFGFQFVEQEEIDFPDGRAIDVRYELTL